MNYIKGPDFFSRPTGGNNLIGLSQLRKAYLTGNGASTVRAKTQIEELDNGKQAIVITEIPFQVNKTRLIERIADTVKGTKKSTGNHRPPGRIEPRRDADRGRTAQGRESERHIEQPL